jgi:hypothetical protein
MASLGFGVRLFEIQSDGVLEPILGVDEDYFCGAVPNVGDTIAMSGLHDVYRFYNVQRRFFVDSSYGDHGWAIIVRANEPAAQMDKVVETWVSDTKFWREVDEQERVEERERLSEMIRKLTRKKKPPEPPQPANKSTRKPRKKVLKPRTPKA